MRRMSEFIINSEQLERMIEAIEHKTSRKINRLIIDGVRQTEIVRCFDCKYGYKDVCERPIWGDGERACMPIEPDGYCKWGKRKECDDD